MTLNDIWVTLFTLVKSITGDVNVKEKGTLQKQIDDCFQSASDGKKLVADAVTGKGVSTVASDTFATMAANIAKIKTLPKLQSKSAALSTAAQTIKPDTGYDGLSQVSVPAVGGTAGTGDVLSGKTFSSAAGVGKTGAMANKGAWTGNTTGSGNVTIPAGYHNGSGYVSGAGAYNKGVTDADARANVNSTNYKTGYNAGVAAADGRTNVDSANYKSGYNAGVAAADGRTNVDSANYKGGYNAGVSATKKGTAGAGDVLSGKTFTNASSVGASGTMANKSGTTLDAGATSQDGTYTYLSIPANGFYNTNSKLRTKNSNLTKGMALPLVCVSVYVGSGGDGSCRYTFLTTGHSSIKLKKSSHRPMCAYDWGYGKDDTSIMQVQCYGNDGTTLLNTLNLTIDGIATLPQGTAYAVLKQPSYQGSGARNSFTYLESA